MYKVKNKLVPNYLCDMFTNVGDVHDHNTRQSGADLTLPKLKTNSMKNAAVLRRCESLELPLCIAKSIDNYC
jgi:hypothetical protein